MRRCSRIFSGWMICLMILPAVAFSAEPDRAIASVLGPHWQMLSRRAGMIFSGTVLRNGLPRERTEPGLPTCEVSFRVEHAIAGVEAGQILTIREWTGVASAQRPFLPGQHVLVFLYPPSRLGLTSPVKGATGVIQLDSNGQRTIEPPIPGDSFRGTPSNPGFAIGRPRSSGPVALEQLERAIRAARGNERGQ